MAENRKRLLIVDDSEIDRETLKNILNKEFNVFEAKNGYVALEILVNRKPKVDAVLLDISMPFMDGFQVLRLMEENKIEDIPVFLITSEATKENVEKAAQFTITEFIKKPFDTDLIISKLRSLFDMTGQNDTKETIGTEDEISETSAYIKKLLSVYKSYILNTGKDYGHIVRVKDIMQILLNEMASKTRNPELDSAHIDFISSAAQFYDIGKMLVPDYINDEAEGEELMNSMEKSIYRNHTVMGADIIWLNSSKGCRFFVQTCADMCMHHHERINGLGYPHGLRGDEIPIYTQMCSLVVKFDEMFYKLSSYDYSRFDVIVTELTREIGSTVEVLKILSSCKIKIVNYYKKHEN